MKRCPIERLFSKVVYDDGCALWCGWISNDGYGHFWLNGKTHMAHRASYILQIGEIPEGYELDHLCRRRNCVNIFHLEPVTRLENERRKPRKCLED